MFTGVFYQGAYGANVNLAIGILAIVATVFTVAYTFWPIKKIFFGELPTRLESVTEAPLTMTLPLLFLAGVAILLGIYPDLVSKALVNFATSIHLLKGGL